MRVLEDVSAAATGAPSEAELREALGAIDQPTGHAPLDDSLTRLRHLLRAP